VKLGDRGLLHALTCSCEVDVVGDEGGGVFELEAIAACCKAWVHGVDERDVRVFAKGCETKDVVNVHVEKAASDRELRGLRELRELAQSVILRKCSDTRGVHTDDSVGP
jgi:hypothetical protein